MPALHQKSNAARRSRRAHAVPKESLAVSISSRNDQVVDTTVEQVMEMPI
jgi:hypothetical protein